MLLQSVKITKGDIAVMSRAAARMLSRQAKGVFGLLAR